MSMQTVTLTRPSRLLSAPASALPVCSEDTDPCRLVICEVFELSAPLIEATPDSRPLMAPDCAASCDSVVAMRFARPTSEADVEAKPSSAWVTLAESDETATASAATVASDEKPVMGSPPRSTLIIRHPTIALAPWMPEATKRAIANAVPAGASSLTACASRISLPVLKSCNADTGF
jgi:hypothetical protein